MTNVQTVSAILDALAEFQGVALDGAQKLELAREFTNNYNPEISTEELAADFLFQLAKTIRKRGRYHLKENRKIRLFAEEEEELNTAPSNLGIFR
jgi:hypothetical protein